MKENNLFKVLGNKYAARIITLIKDNGSLRFSRIEGEFKTISPRTLSIVLRKLESENIIVRKVFPEVPPRVEYSITNYGVKVSKVIDIINNINQ